VIIFQDIEEHRAKSLRPDIDLMELLLKKYQEYADVFSKAASDELLPHQLYDYFIQLKSDANCIRYTLLRRMSDEELREVKRYLDENL
jgi:hypothetical protein